MTLGCGPGGRRAPQSDCTPARFAAIDRRFDDERISGRLARDLGYSNLNVAGSGLFLSGWYAKRPDVMALAVIHPTPDATAPVSPDEQASIDGAEGHLRLATVLSSLGLAPVEEVARPYRPERASSPVGTGRDWEHLTDYLHHKLLFVDGSHLQLGGRNIEDSYHMHPNPLVDKKYVFMDTDLVVDVARGGEDVARAFERLWGFRAMVASLAEVRLHAPNDRVANSEAAAAAKKACAGSADPAARARCEGNEYNRRALGLPARENQRAQEMRDAVEGYRKYTAESPEPVGWGVDSGAAFSYIENLPFQGGPGALGTTRSYGAKNGEEADWGKRIHGLWLAALTNVCRTATAESPKRVLLHNAYFFPPTNFTRAIGRMVDGGIDCGHASITVVTNSIDTTDLNVVNILARHQLKAFAEHASAHRDPARSAGLAFFEYKKPDVGPNRSLHSKVFVLGDDLFVGSANADVRSYMMDGNNGLFVRRAPLLRAAYLRHVDGILHDPARTRELTDYLASVSREQMKTEDQAIFQGLLAQYHAETSLNEAQRGLAEAAFLGLLDKVYALTKAALAGEPDADARAEEFNRLFQPI